MWSAGGTHHIFADPFGDVFARRRSWSADAMCRSFGHCCRRVSWRLIACLVFGVPTQQSTHFFKYCTSIHSQKNWILRNKHNFNSFWTWPSRKMRFWNPTVSHKKAISTNINGRFMSLFFDAKNRGTFRRSPWKSRCQETSQTLGLGCNGILTKDSGVFQLDFLRTGHCGEVVNPQIQKSCWFVNFDHFLHVLILAMSLSHGQWLVMGNWIKTGISCSNVWSFLFFPPLLVDLLNKKTPPSSCVIKLGSINP